MKVLGVTGGIGSGKTTVCGIFKTLGVPVFSSDEVSKDILFTPHIQKKVEELFGNQVLQNGVLSKQKLAKYIFSSEDALESLNQLLHPKVSEAFETWKKHQKHNVVIKEAAILFESGGDKSCDYVLNVYCSEQERIRRVLLRDDRSELEIKAIIARQWSDNERKKHSDFTINNESEKLIPQVLNLYATLMDKV
tara:strand:+ start:303 stop:881 length:579 start_codon:yes stop_codon:yes gene_type:complete